MRILSSGTSHLPPKSCRKLALTSIIFALSGCVNVANQSAICDGTQDARAAHAEALASEASDAAVITGARLIALLDAGCGDAG
jgi:hypothetical protein